MRIRAIVLILLNFWVGIYLLAQDSSLQLPSSFKSEKDFVDFLNDNEFLGSYQNKQKYFEFIQETQNKFSSSTSDVAIEMNYRIAQILFDYQQHQEAYQYIDRTNTLLSQRKDVPDLKCLTHYYHLLGEFSYRYNRYDEAKLAFEKSLQMPYEDLRTSIKSLNTLGVIYMIEKDYPEAIENYNQSLKIAKSIQSDEWIGIINGNLGLIYFRNHEYDQAKPLLEKDLRLSLQNNETESALSSVAVLIELAIVEQNNDAISEYVQTLDSLGLIVTDWLSKRLYHSTKTVYYEYLEDYSASLQEFKLKQNYQDSISAKFNETNLSNMVFQIDYEKAKSAHELVVEKAKYRSRLFYGIFIVLTIIVVACIYIIYLLRNAKRQERQLLEIKNERILNELEQNKREMKMMLENIMKQNELIKTLSTEIELHEREEELEEINEEILSSTLLTKNDLDRFNNLFDKIHPDFRKNLLEKHADITKAELRFAMLTKLDLSRNEMSNVLGISEESVRKTNLRIRKKLNIETSHELKAFLNDF